jgi:hypothetical protein
VLMTHMTAMAAMLGAFALITLSGDGETGKELLDLLRTAGRTFDFGRRARRNGLFESLLTVAAGVLVARHAFLSLAHPPSPGILAQTAPPVVRLLVGDPVAQLDRAGAF